MKFIVEINQFSRVFDGVSEGGFYKILKWGFASRFSEIYDTNKVHINQNSFGLWWEAVGCCERFLFILHNSSRGRP